MPLNKALGSDNIFTEMLVASEDVELTELTGLTNMMYQEGCFPENNEQFHIHHSTKSQWNSKM